MDIVCQNCNTKHHLSEDKIPLETKVGKCRKCKSPITVLGKNSPKNLVVIDVKPSKLVTTKKYSSKIIPSEEDTKRCDFCGEKILAIAKKCKHCGEILDVTLRAVEEAKTTNSSPNVYMNAAVTSNENSKHNFPHIWHLFGTIITFGWWAIIWILHYLLRDKNYYQ